MASCRPLLCLLVVSLLAADALKVTMKAPRISVLRDERVTIPCEFSEFSSGKIINVHWSRSQNDDSSVVYNFIPGRQQITTRYYMANESDIQRGNAALHITQARFSDEGAYTCTVIVTPESKEGSSTLEVSAVPTADLLYGDAINVELGSEKSVACEVSNFYPKDINICWARQEKNSTDYKVLERGTCTGDAIANTDGTFNVTSHLTLYPKMEDSGYKYSCVVKHRSVPEGLRKDFTLTVAEPEDNSGRIAAAVICTLVAALLVFAAGLLYYEVFRKDPPVLSDISGNDQIIHMTRTTLTCQIMRFKPAELEISVYLKRRGEMTPMLTWKQRDDDSSARGNDGGDSAAIDPEQQRLVNGDVSHTQRPLELAVTPTMTRHASRLLGCIQWRRLFSYSCQCILLISPSCTEDDGAELSVHVSHSALAAAVSRKRILKVIGVPPTLLKIISPSYVTHGELSTLICPINGFKPRTLHITWLRKGEDGSETEVVTWKSDDGSDGRSEDHKVTENEHEDKSYSFQSALTIRPTVKEDGFRYICRTFHPATQKVAKQMFVIPVTAVPVLDDIKQTQDEVSPVGGKVYVGKRMKLSCKIHSFYPAASIEVTWYRGNGQSLPSNTSNALPDSSGMFQVTSTMTYSPTLKDLRNIFRCEVKHQSTGTSRAAWWSLEDLVSVPEVSDIRFAAASSELLTLSCDISKLYPGTVIVQWYNGTCLLSQDMCRESLQEDPATGMFCGTLELSYRADGEYQEQEFRMEMIHCGKTIDRRFRLLLAGLPVLSDIISEPRDPNYGQSVTLHCKVTNSKPQDVTVKWLRGERHLERGQGYEKRITEEDGSISCSLRITATALDCAKVYSCSVKHKDMASAIKKNYYLHLPDEPPRFSAITVRPESPVVGEEAVFTVTISGFSPDIRVKWYKGFSRFPSDVVVTTDPQLGKDSLLTCCSTLRFIPQDKDHNMSVRCEVTHSVTKKVHEQLYTLHLTGRSSVAPEELISGPDSGHCWLPLTPRGVQCVTKSPRVGGDVTLVCYVDRCDVKYAEFSWRKGLFPIDGEIQNKTLSDGSGASTITFTAQEADRDCIITCEVTYNFKVREERYTLKLQ